MANESITNNGGSAGSPARRFTTKQLIAGGVVAALIAGGGAAVLFNRNDDESAAALAFIDCDPAEHPGTSVPEDCAADAFAANLAAPRSVALDGIDDATIEGYVGELCDTSRLIGSLEGPRPLRSTTLGTLTAKWGVDGAAGEELVALARLRCPEDFAPFDSLPRTGEPVRATLSVDGSGPLSITYSDADGERIVEVAVGPWSLEVVLNAPRELSLEVRGTDAEPLACAISLGDNVLSNDSMKTASSSTSVRCSVTALDLEQAAVSAPVSTSSPVAAMPDTTSENSVET